MEKNLVPTVLCYHDKIDSVCSFWRSQNPLSELSRQGHINIIQGSWGLDDWTIIRMADIAFFQRPMNKECFNQIALCKDLGLKIWIDFDDYNQIPVHHEVYKLWSQIYSEKEFIKIMMLADIVSVSTDYLKTHYSKYSQNTVIIPNSINDYIYKFSEQSKNKSIVYRGGNHHSMDIYEYKNQIINVLKQNPDYKLYSIGYDPLFIKNEVSNYEFLGDLNIHQYFATIKNINPSIFLVPLLDNEFNRGKSNISWIEATIAGAVALTPHWWKLNNCAMQYRSASTFEDGFNYLITNNNLREDLFSNSKEFITKKLSLSKTNKKRIDIIKKLLK